MTDDSGPSQRGAMSVLGTTTTSIVSKMLGTGYSNFESPSGVRGLAKTDGDRLDILAVESDIQGAGQFRLFIRLCKQEFRSIYVWHVLNPHMNAILRRYGFLPIQETHDGEVLNGYRWSLD